MRARPGLTLALALSLAGCSGNLPPVGVVDKLRLLAVRAEPPEAAAGQTVALDALVVEPLEPALDGAAPRPPSYVWQACPSVPNASGTETPCAPSAPPIAESPGAWFVPAAAGDVTITLTVSDGVQTIVAVKRLPVRDPSGQTPNRNPRLDAFTLADAGGDAGFVLDGDDDLTDGGAYSLSPANAKLQLELTATRAADAAELEAGPDGQGTQYETLTVAWFTTAGTIDASRTIFTPPGCDTPQACPQLAPDATARARWSAPTAVELAASAPPDGSVDFWAVIRDDRGGVGWLAGRARP